MTKIARTPLVVLALVLVAALVGSSCSTVAPQALQVNGYSLSERAFLDQLASIAGNQAYLDARAAQGRAVVITGTNPNTYTTQFTAEFLNERVSFVLATQENAERGLEVTDADRRNAEVLISLNLSPNPARSDGTVADPAGLAVLDGFSSAYRDALVDGVANILVLRRDILDRAATDEGLRALYDAQQATAVDQACARHILVRAGNGQTRPTDAELAAALSRAQELRAQIPNADAFAASAVANSQDPGSAAAGGDLGCAPQGAYVAAFDAAVWSQPVGEIGQPVQTDFGYHLVLVTARGRLSFDQQRDSLAAAVEQNSDALLTDWLTAAAVQATVSVDPKFGRWDPETGQVLTPEGAQAPGGPAALPTELQGLLDGASPQG